jgi:hypothetical protein
MKPGIAGRPARRKLGMIACGLALLASLAAGCGSGGSSPAGSTPSGGASSPAATATTAPPASPASPGNSVLCADAAALRASLDKLRHVTVGAGTVNQITADLQDVKTALTTFASNARSQWQAQTSALNAALGKLGTAVSSLTASPGTSTVSGVVSALGEVNTAAQNLLAAVNTSCPSASASAGS